MSSINSQLADTNISNEDLRIAQSIPSESTMYNQHTMCETYQQQYMQPTVYDVENNTEQRDDLLRSLAQNPQMLNDFGQFLDFIRARSAQQSYQPSMNGQIIQGHRQIPSILDNLSNMQHKSSTPKRGRPLNESGGSISSAPKQHKPSKVATGQSEVVTTTNQQHRKPLPFDQLKRAVSSNLPCFFIEFEQVDTSNRLPSAFEARNIIEKHFVEQNIRIQQFTLVGWANKQLKLGVNNKEDYMMLANTDKWPTSVKNIPVKIIKPKFIPDCFALVVRYVPRDMESESVTEEIKRTITSAVNIKQIHYAYERKTNDFRFAVTDLNEYNTALKLGRIAIHNRWLTVTPFLTGNRMTYCTRCWEVGHRREQCKAISNRCRVCLEVLTKKEDHQCSNISKCAQCGGNHHSLDGQCHVIRQYRADLKEDVVKALESGKLHRSEFNNQQQVCNMNNQEFPSLGESNKPSQPVWNRGQVDTRISEESNSTKALLLINENLVAMRESNRRVEEKLERIESKLNQTALDTELHQTTLIKLIETTSSLVEHIIWPVTSQINPTLLKSKNGLQSVFDMLRALKSNLSNDYGIRRKRATSPPIQSNSSATSVIMNSDKTLIEKQS